MRKAKSANFTEDTAVVIVGLSAMLEAAYVATITGGVIHDSTA